MAINGWRARSDKCLSAHANADHFIYIISSRSAQFCSFRRRKVIVEAIPKPIKRSRIILLDLTDVWSIQLANLQYLIFFSCLPSYLVTNHTLLKQLSMEWVNRRKLREKGSSMNKISQSTRLSRWPRVADDITTARLQNPLGYRTRGEDAFSQGYSGLALHGLFCNPSRKERLIKLIPFFFLYDRNAFNSQISHGVSAWSYICLKAKVI